MYFYYMGDKNYGYLVTYGICASWAQTNCYQDSVDQQTTSWVFKRFGSEFQNNHQHWFVGTFNRRVSNKIKDAPQISLKIIQSLSVNVYKVGIT